jgi:hypothetical protein
MRRLTTKHPSKVAKYLTEIQQRFDAHNITERSLALYVRASNPKHTWTVNDQQAYDTLDNDITRAMLAAEHNCGGATHSTPWFPALDKAIATQRYWKFRYKQQKFNINLSESIAILRSNHDITDTDANDMPYITSQLNEARSKLKHLRKNGKTLREEYLNARASQEAARHNQSVETVLKRIIAAERFQEIFQRLRHALDRQQRPGLTRLKVPSEACDPATLQPTTSLDSYPPTSNEWVALDDKQLIEDHLIARNNTHYRQANSTPFGTTERGTTLGFHGTSSDAAAILDGNYQPPPGDTLPKETAAYIQALHHPDNNIPALDRNTIDVDISVADLVQGFGKWPENTSTSPSGRHLGHYRSLLYLQDEDGNYPLLEILQYMINIPLLTGQPPKRWLTASSVCIEKEQGNPQTDKIRIIHLYEADLNLILKLLWGKRLVRNAENHNLYPDAQYGSRPGRNSIDAVLCKLFCFEFSRVSRSSMGLLDNDAVANYDRIICSLSSIACQRLGMPQIVEHLHNEILLRLRYNVKTGFGTSANTYGAEPNNPLQGQGQGSGNAPSCWGAISTPMWTALRELCQHSFTATSVDLHHAIDTQGVAFVDDATNLLNDMASSTPMDEATLIHALQTLAQMWERLLFSTGGALKPSKCFWYAITWQWASGFPIMRSSNKFNHSVTITDSTTNTSVPITQKSGSEAERTLGVRIAPNGSQQRELAWLRAKAHSFALHISNGKLSREEAHRAYHSIYIPSLTYSLGATCFNPTEAASIQKGSLHLILASMGINRNMPRSVVFAPTNLGGLGFKCLYTEQGCQQIENFIGHLRIDSTVGKLMRSTLSFHQLTAGTSGSLLAMPSTDIPYLEKGWITSLRSFLASINGTIEIDNHFQLHPVRHNDCILMDSFNDPNSLASTVERINHCRLFLQVTSLADLCNGTGTALLPAAYHGHPLPDSHSTLKWPRQVRPPASSWAAWQHALRKWFLTDDPNSLCLRPSACLGHWLPSLTTHHRRWHYHINPSSGHAWHHPKNTNQPRFHQSLSLPNPDGKFRTSGKGTTCDTTTAAANPQDSAAIRIPATVLLSSSATLLLSAVSYHPPLTLHTVRPTSPTEFPSFPDYVKSLDAWERRLLFSTKTYNELLINALINGSVTIASDGSMRFPNLTFGWAIGTETATLSTGHGPADGAHQYQSSQRAELYGMLAALRFLYRFIIYHNLNTNHRILLVCDNQSAIKYATPPRHQGSAIYNNHADYDVAHEIHVTIGLLPMPIKLQWVRGHQNRSSDISHLPREAQLNIIADDLATSFHQRESQAARSHPCAHPFPSCHASLIIAGQRVTRNHKANIREAARGPQYFAYLRERNGWDSADILDNIDWTSHGKALHSLPVPSRLAVIKFLHRWLPTNHNLHKQNHTNPKCCGLCQAPDEDDDHMCLCPHTSATLIRAKALEDLTAALSACATDPTISDLLLEGCHAWFSHGKTTIDTRAPDDHPFREVLDLAIEEQNSIGWNQILRGRLSLAWGFCYKKWQSLHPPTEKSARLDSGTWTTRIIKWAMSTFLALWKNRNTQLFTTSDQHDTTEERLRLQAETRERHSRRPPDLPHGDLLAYFNEPLDTLLLRRNHVLRVWIAHVDRIYIRHRNEINQRTKRSLLTYYFTRRHSLSNQHSLS